MKKFGRVPSASELRLLDNGQGELCGDQANEARIQCKVRVAAMRARRAWHGMGRVQIARALQE
jgi:hypothetical protein